ncbi:hypothetical protein D3C71_1563300 [compost metagenome]
MKASSIAASSTGKPGPASSIQRMPSNAGCRPHCARLDAWLARPRGKLTPFAPTSAPVISQAVATSGARKKTQASMTARKVRTPGHQRSQQ